MRDFLPSGLKGLLIVGFLSAYMSTISTQFNWGTGYLINDFYKRFVKPKASQKHLITAARVVTLVLMILALFVTLYLQTLQDAFYFVVEASAGLGLVLILRWYWWRVNVWSEIIASVVPLIVYSIVHFYTSIEHPYSLFITVSITTIAWLGGTYLTRPTPDKTLKEFCRRVQPTGSWKVVYQKMGMRLPKSNLKELFFLWATSIIMIYALLIGIGKIIFQDWLQAGILIGLAMLILTFLAKKIK